MYLHKLGLLTAGLALALPGAAFAAKAKSPRPPKSHSVALGATHKMPYSIAGDPASAQPGETELRVRPLVVDGKVKEWTTGEVHDVTSRSFTVRRAVKLNDALPTDHDEHWVWQRGPWLLVDRGTGHITALHLPDYNAAISDVVWFRDYAAYCGLNASGKQLYGVVAQLTIRKPMLATKLELWGAGAHPSPACAPAVWQRAPLQVTFQPTGAAPASFILAGSSTALVEDNSAAASAP
jgi:hypothetical protein